MALFQCQSAVHFSVLWPPENPRYRVTYGPKHNWTSLSRLGFWCSCPDTEIRRHPSGKLLLHKGHPEWDEKLCKHCNQVKTIWCGWQQQPGEFVSMVNGQAFCPKCGLPAVEGIHETA